VRTEHEQTVTAGSLTDESDPAETLMEHVVGVKRQVGGHGNTIRVYLSVQLASTVQSITSEGYPSSFHNFMSTP